MDPAPTGTLSRGLRALAAAIGWTRPPRVGPYELDRELGRGGVARVYRTRRRDQRPAAVKVLPADADALARARFEREHRLSARLEHPNTIAVYESGRSAAGEHYYAMELVEGADLETIVTATGPMPAARATSVLEMIASALSRAHALGILHRDVKPSNVMLAEVAGRDVAKLVDFGLAKDASDHALTQTGTLAGTPLYMAPEAIAEPTSVDPAADVYALGAVAYYLLTGTPVFSSPSLVGLFAQHLYSTPVAPSLRTGQPLPSELERLVLECLAKHRYHRPSAEEARRRLAALARAHPWPPSARWWAEFRRT